MYYKLCFGIFDLIKIKQRLFFENLNLKPKNMYKLDFSSHC